VIPLARRPRRVAGTRPAGDVGTLWIPPDGTALARLPRASLALLQQILITLGYTDSGGMRADGLPGTHTRNATTAFQRDMQPARLAAETTPLGERVRAFASIVGNLRADGDLGPKTQQWLRWLATPIAQGGGGEAAGHDRVPVVGVTPEVLAARGGRFAAPTERVEVPPPSTPRAALVAREYLAANPIGLRVAGRRTVLLGGLDPAVGARVFVDGRDVTLGLPEEGVRPGWVTVQGAPLWRFGVPEGSSAITVQRPNGEPVVLTLTPPGAEDALVARIAVLAMPGTAPVVPPAPVDPTLPSSPGAPPVPAPPPAPSTASMMSGVAVVGGLAALVAVVLAATKPAVRARTREGSRGSASPADHAAAAT
jgi:peptidoglycan hydrolase-like protein with peptidoglycan-binding domain